MTIGSFIVGGIACIIFVYVIILFNGLVRLKNNAARCLANIDVVLKQRHTEIPRLIEVCKGYMKHEKSVLVALVEAREKVHVAQDEGNIKKLGKAEDEFRIGLANFYARVEAYPELKANENFLQLQERISQMEDVIADRREIYNEAVKLNNTRIQIIPDVFIAKLFNFGGLEYLQFSDHEMQPVSIENLHG
jgi:LemA protein